MRNPASRIFFAALLALLIPIQGIGAITTSQCMTLEHHQGASGGHDGHSHDGDDGAAHSHDGAGDGQASEDTANGSHCGPCTACCASATISSPLALSITSPESSAQHLFSQSAPPSVQLDELDRPPLALCRLAEPARA